MERERDKAAEHENPNRLMREYGSAKVIHVINLMDCLRHLKDQGKKVYLESDIHWNEYGRQKAAQQVAHSLCQLLYAA